MQPLDFVEWHVGSGRVVGIREEYHLGALGHRCEHRIYISGEVLLGCHHRCSTFTQRRDWIDQKPMRGVNCLIAVAKVGVGKEVQELVGARAANNAIGVESKGAPDRLPQGGRRAVGIVLQVRSE